jgi:hypothetical protein
VEAVGNARQMDCRLAIERAWVDHIKSSVAKPIALFNYLGRITSSALTP